jgi:nitrite reductase/ring-hydroxylating ferredoxin subunit/uncharacterized membrane protein
MLTEKQAEETRSWIETPPLSPPLRRMTGELIERQSWLDKLADPLQQWLRSLARQPRVARVKDILHGTWLGHSLHPAITDIPIGSWSATMLLDCIWLTSGSEELGKAADLTLVLGLAGAGVSALSGLSDWSETDATDRRVGMAHGLLNAGAILSNLTSYGLRMAGKRRSGIVLSALGYCLTLFSSYLGGELSLAKAIGVNHVAWQEGPDDFVPVMALDDLPTGRLVRVEAAGMPALLWRDNQQIYAIAATCSHLGGPLDEGTCEDGVVTCPWHGSRFRLSDGSVVNGPAVYAQPSFAVRVRQGKVELRRLEHA